MTPLLATLVGAAATILLVVVIVAIIAHRRQRMKRERVQHQVVAQTIQPSCSKTISTTMTSARTDRQASMCFDSVAIRNDPVESSLFHKDPDIIVRDAGMPLVCSQFHLKA